MRDLYQDATELALASLPINYDRCENKSSFNVAQEFIYARERYLRELPELDQNSYPADN